MTQRRPFAVLTGSTVLARIPLLPAADCDDQALAVDPVLAEGMFLASRQADTALAGTRDEGQRLAATVRAYELRAQWRPTPHGVFSGVAVAQIADHDADLRLGGAHRARTYPSPAWMARFADLILDLPDVASLLSLTTSNLVVQRGQRLEHEQQVLPGVAGPQRVSVRATEASMLILRICERGALYPAVLAEITRRWPTATPETGVPHGAQHGSRRLSPERPGPRQQSPGSTRACAGQAAQLVLPA